MKNSNDTIGNRTRDLPVSVAVPLFSSLHECRSHYGLVCLSLSLFTVVCIL